MPRTLVIILLLLTTSSAYATEVAANPTQEQNKNLTGAGLVVQMRFEALAKRALGHDAACKKAIRHLLKLMMNPHYEISDESHAILMEYRLITAEDEVNIIMFKVIQLPHIQGYLTQLFARE